MDLLTYLRRTTINLQGWISRDIVEEARTHALSSNYQQLLLLFILAPSLFSLAKPALVMNTFCF